MKTMTVWEAIAFCNDKGNNAMDLSIQLTSFYFTI